jgi:hypothetical protein
MDNGPEYIAKLALEFSEVYEMSLGNIPGKPMQKAISSSLINPIAMEY